MEDLKDLPIPEDLESVALVTAESLSNIANLEFNMRCYLSYRSCGFTFRESCQLAGINEVTARRWRELNPVFKKLDTEEVGKLMTQFSQRFLEVEYMRNYRLVLRKDYDILVKSIAAPDKMTPAEVNYLLKARGYYAPEQLNSVKGLVEGGASGFDFTKTVLSINQRGNGVDVEVSSGTVRKT